MLVTTKGRYAMRMMVYIAGFPEGEKVALRHVSEAESISLKYLEQLAHSLVSDGLLKSVRGHGGGYVLGKPAEEITAGEILRAVEGTTVPVACAALEEGGEVIERYVDNVTLAELSADDDGRTFGLEVADK